MISAVIQKSGKKTGKRTPKVGSANASTCKDAFTVINNKGLHTRPSTEIVKCAIKYRSEITLSYNGLTINAKSLLDVMRLSAVVGARVTVTAKGRDAQEAVAEILALAKIKFKHQY